MGRIAVIAVLLIAALATISPYPGAGRGHAQELKPHEGFKGVRWGATVEEMLKVFTNAYPKPADLATPREKIYFVGSNVGAVHVDLYLYFLDEKFGQALMRFDRPEVNRVVEIFKERYGPPFIEEATLLNWSIRGTSVVISPPDGVAVVSSPDFDRYTGERRRRYLKEAVKDL